MWIIFILTERYDNKVIYYFNYFERINKENIVRCFICKNFKQSYIIKINNIYYPTLPIVQIVYRIQKYLMVLKYLFGI